MRMIIDIIIICNIFLTVFIQNQPLQSIVPPPQIGRQLRGMQFGPNLKM